MATSAAAAMAVARRRVFSHFFAANAVTPENAVPFATDRRLQQRQFERFLARGVIREAKPGRYYVDMPAWNAWHSDTHMRLKIVLLAAVLVIGGVLFFTLGKG
ncbi:hypothetical protein OF829_17260 [Sphingomonas sp. LB-2]|uniref:hypothetical protein n=1 Tax=Sphingomonas caeni TaxID=2984949 RepID=UPI0022306B4B|nr:hypothetical protein [Sphingomonas caeni]MCW3848990.1 hypothetical protein [Sphingomonas caeni]